MAKIFNITFTDKNQDETIELIANLIKVNAPFPLQVVTANPEMVMNAQKDKELMRVIQNADLVTPDGIGVVIAAKLFNENLSERVTGYDTVIGLFDKSEKEKKKLTVYFLGASEEVVREATRKIEERYNYVKIVGYHNGFFDDKKEKIIISDINNSKAQLLLVALGSPKQEYFIYRNKTKLDVRVAMGVGGTLDVISGSVKRAPKFVRKINLEWLYRLFQNPKRIFRQTVLFKFMAIVLFKKFKRDY